MVTKNVELETKFLDRQKIEEGFRDLIILERSVFVRDIVGVDSLL